MDSSDIQEIYSNSDRLVNHVDSSWRRYIYHQIDWKNDLIAINSQCRTVRRYAGSGRHDLFHSAENATHAFHFGWHSATDS